MKKIIATTVAISVLMMGCGGSGGKSTQPSQSSSGDVISSAVSSLIASSSIAPGSSSVSSEDISSASVYSSEFSSSVKTSNSSSSNAPLLTGVFLDSAVVNIGYRTATVEGFTNERGEFNYHAGESITFFIGALEFPSVIAKDILTPEDIGKMSGAKNNVVINIIRLLQSLDVDGDPANGIEISETALAVAEPMDLTLNPQFFARLDEVEHLLWLSDAPTRELIPAQQALDHFKATLASINGTASSSSSQSSDAVAIRSSSSANSSEAVVASSSASSESSSSVSSFAPVNNILPFTENFMVENVVQLFSPAYKSLLNPNSDDQNPSFYYPVTALDTGRIVASNGSMTMGNARMTLGQDLQTTGTHINPAALPLNYKANTTTDGMDVNFPTTSTWGELDLSHPWKLSFCVKEAEAVSGSPSNQQFMVYVDNNTASIMNSIHSNNSLVKQINVANFAAGKRVEINFPGDLLVGGVAIDSVVQNPGTSSSFIQLRVPSAAILTMSELWVGYQADTASEPAANTCVAGERVSGWNMVPVPDVPSAPTVKPGNQVLEVSWDAAARATSYTLAYNTTDSIAGASLVEAITGNSTVITGLANGTGYYVFIKAINSIGASEFSPSAYVVPRAPVVVPETPSGLTAYGDNQSALVSWTASDGAESYALSFNTMNETTTATMITGLTNTYQRLTGLVNNTTYYLFVKAGNTAGESEYTSAQVVTPNSSSYLYQAMLNVPKDIFFGANGPALQTLGSSSEVPMHFIAGGGSGITLEEGGIRLASGGRFTIGQVVAPNVDGVVTQTNTAPTDVSVNGVLDLSGYYKIIINVVSAPDNNGLFQVYLDNNTTAGANSIHQTAANSRLINRTASTIVDGEEIVYEMATNRRGTATSFIQLRADSAIGAEGILINGIRIEAMDAP